MRNLAWVFQLNQVQKMAYAEQIAIREKWQSGGEDYAGPQLANKAGIQFPPNHSSFLSFHASTEGTRWHGMRQQTYQKQAQSTDEVEALGCFHEFTWVFV